MSTVKRAIPGSELAVGMVWWPDTRRHLTVETIDNACDKDGTAYMAGDHPLMVAEGDGTWRGRSTRFSATFYPHDWVVVES